MRDEAGAAPALRESRDAATADVAEATGAKPSAPAVYVDGSPLDDVTYLEAKLILNPERFTSAKALRDFGKVVRKTAVAMNVGLTHSLDYYLSPKIREIVFADTPDFALYGAGFILRRRISYRSGFPVGDPEFVLKFRHPEFERAAALDMRLKTEGRYRIKFKAELLPLRDRVGGQRVLYSHNCQFGLGPAARAEWMAIERLTEAFPVLGALSSRPSACRWSTRVSSRKCSCRSACSISETVLRPAATSPCGGRVASIIPWLESSPFRRSSRRSRRWRPSRARVAKRFTPRFNMRPRTVWRSA